MGLFTELTAIGTLSMKDNQNNFIYTEYLSEELKTAKYYCVRNTLRCLTETRLQSSSDMPVTITKERQGKRSDM